MAKIEKEESYIRRALRSIGSIFSARGAIEGPKAPDRKAREDMVKEALFQKDPGRILNCFREDKGSILCAAKLLLSDDYVFSSGWALAFAAKNKLDISVAVPYLDELLSHKEMDARSYAAKALTFHYLNMGDREKLVPRMRSCGDESVTREIADAFLEEIGRGNIFAVKIVLESLSYPDKEVRTFSAYILDNAPGYCSGESREVLKSALLQFKRERRVLHLDTYRFIDDALRAIELQK